MAFSRAGLALSHHARRQVRRTQLRVTRNIARGGNAGGLMMAVVAGVLYGTVSVAV